MRLRNILTSSLIFKIVFVISVFLLFLTAGISYKQIQSLNESEKLVSHSYHVRLQLEQLLSYLKDAETGQRGYIITHDSSFLEPYLVSDPKIDSSLNNLQLLLADNVKQKQNFSNLKELISKRFIILNSAMTQRDLQPFIISDSLRNRLTLGKKTMDSVRHQVYDMISFELERLKVRESEYNKNTLLSPFASFIVVLFALLVFVFSYFKINKDRKFTTKLNTMLISQNDIFNHAEEISAMGSYAWNMHTGHIEYSDNFPRIFGDTKTGIGSNENSFYKYIHPDDVAAVKHIIGETAAGKKTVSWDYRVITKSGELKRIQATGRMLNYNNNEDIFSGTIQDVTAIHLFNQQLEEYNHELELRNAELSSFNHVASHDLQEPLRKIQTFISRINEKGLDLKSETVLNYFERIQASANRMQKLIEDLLMFSRATRSEKVYESSDLNMLLENAKQELSQVIEDKQAVIESDELPVMNVIPFQFTQLFINIISNSIKYSKPGIAPHIRITGSIVPGSKVPDSKANPAKQYYKISISDNGIGFEQQYADNIFVLFRRLHDRKQYSGTGIGLAICKKNIENHHGFINAEGVPGLGATFNIYLPYLAAGGIQVI